MALTGKTIGQLTYVDYTTNNFLIPIEEAGTTYHIGLSATGFVHYWWGNDLAVNTALSINTWYNVVARFDGTNRQIWLNNVLIGGDTPGSSHNVPNANNLTIGTTNVNEYFNGKISNVEIYDRAISDSEIAEIYNNFIYRFT